MSKTAQRRRRVATGPQIAQYRARADPLQPSAHRRVGRRPTSSPAVFSLHSWTDALDPGASRGFSGTGWTDVLQSGALWVIVALAFTWTGVAGFLPPRHLGPEDTLPPQ